MSTSYERFEVPVAGGAIAAGRWGTGERLALASHGITANHLSWQRVGELLDQRSAGALSLVAVDHRGRAGSAATPGPYGMAAHADDLVAVMDHFGLDSAVLAGHSMGGFVVATAAERHPARVERLVLVDGGLPFGIVAPEAADGDVDVESVVQSVIGPALDRLDQRWDDEAGYVDFFRAHPAFQPPNRWTPVVEAYVRYDAVTTADGDVGSSVSKEAVLVDGGEGIVDPHSAAAIERISCPATLVWAPRGILDQAPGLYDSARIDAATGAMAHLDAALVDDTNHYTILVDDAGAGAVVEAILT